MTGRQAASSKPRLARPRLARKGLAVPAGPAGQPGLADQPGLAEAGSASSARPGAGAGSGAEMDREASTETSAPITNPEAAPAASLLPFDFPDARGPSFDPARLPRAEPQVTLGPPAGPSAGPSAEPLAKPPAAPLAAPPAEAAARPKPEAAPATSATPAKAEAPRVDPSWRIGHDPKPARPGRRRARPVLAAALAVAAVLGLGWHAHRAGWLDFEAPTAERVEAPNETAATEAPTRETPGPEAPGAAPPVAEKIVAEKTVGTVASSAPASALTPALSPAAAPADEDADAGQAPEATPPSIDVVRVEPDGAAVIAGRAAPGAELIVLDNGAPIGTATADAFGEWVFIPDAPLPAGAHEFGLVVKRVQGGATLPAAGEAGEAREQGPAGGAPAPRKVERGEVGRGKAGRVNWGQVLYYKALAFAPEGKLPGHTNDPVRLGVASAGP